ncbi:MAG: hypothetical protein HY849_06205 [Nitrosomonadales bacterium]|nr:hypothetical protein [Nitrosomonadales bacterium]
MSASLSSWGHPLSDFLGLARLAGEAIMAVYALVLDLCCYAASGVSIHAERTDGGVANP